jgi:hypothetical protein
MANEKIKFLSSNVKIEADPLEPDQIIWTNLTGSYKGICSQLCQLQLEVIVFASMAILIGVIHLALHWTLKDFHR